MLGDLVRLIISVRCTILSSLPMGSTATLLSFFYCLQYQGQLPLDVHESLRLWENIALLPYTLLCHYSNNNCTEACAKIVNEEGGRVVSGLK